MSLIEDIISHVIMPEYSRMLIDILESKSVNTVALVTMIVSVYTAASYTHLDVYKRQLLNLLKLMETL